MPASLPCAECGRTIYQRVWWEKEDTKGEPLECVHLRCMAQLKGFVMKSKPKAECKQCAVDRMISETEASDPSMRSFEKICFECDKRDRLQ